MVEQPGRHPDLGNDVELEITGALSDKLCGKVIYVERDDVHRVKTHGFRFVQEREIALGKGLAKQ
jgi:hypothetical protein